MGILTDMKVGTFVRSEFRSRWEGVVIKVETGRCKKWANGGYYSSVTYTDCTVLILRDKNGNVPHRRIIKYLDAGWLTEIPSIDMSHINKDWLKI